MGGISRHGIQSAFLLPPVHPLDVILVVCLQLLPLQLESVGDQARLWGPGFRAEANLSGDLEPLQLGCGETMAKTKQNVHHAQDRKRMTSQNRKRVVAETGNTL